MNIYNLLWRRYYKALVTGMVLILGIFIYQTSSQINEWHSTNRFMQSQTFKDGYANDLKALDGYAHKTQRQRARINDSRNFILADNEANHPLSEAQFVKRGLQFFTPYAHLQPHPSYSYLENGGMRDNGWFVAEMIIPIGLSCIVVLMSLLAEDNAQNFNLFLASTRFKRSKVMLAKMTLLVGLPIVAIALGYGIYFASVYFAIPTEYYNIGSKVADFGQLFNAFGWGLFASMIVCLSSVVIGKRFGSAILSTLFLLSLQLLSQAIAHTIGVKYQGMHTFNKFIQSPQVGVALIVVALIITAITMRVFSHLSLERNDRFVMFSKFRWPLWWISVIYTGYVFFETTRDAGTPTEANIIVIVLWLVINITMYYFIFTPQTLRHPFKSIN